MARAARLGFVAWGLALICMGCTADGSRRQYAGRPWLDAEGEWSARVQDGRVQAQVHLDAAGLFGHDLTLTNEQARVQVGPLSAQLADGQPLQLQPARMSRPISMQREALELSQVLPDKHEIRTTILPGEVTVIQVAGGEVLSRLTLPVKIDGVELLAMDYGWLMRRPGRFVRNRVMTDFILAEGKTQSLLLGSDQSWRFEVDPAGQLAAVALHRATVVRFFVGVAPKGHWPRLVQAYRKIAHSDWEEPMDPVEQRRLASLVGRMVLDDWSNMRCDQLPPILDRLRFLGCDNLLLVRHNWQHYGYDVKLPATWPPRENIGGVTGLMNLSQYCRANGILFGLHENFIDLYKDTPDRDDWAIAYHPREYHEDGKLREYKGWLNTGTGQQAVRHTPGSALRALRRNLEQQQRLQPGTIFLDVTSYVDPDPLQTEAGVYVGTEKVLQASRDLYGQAASTVLGPVLGEGCTEKFLGSLQGANCDLWDVDRWGNKAGAADWEYFPLLDWLAHDRVVFQGVGYLARYGVPDQVEFTASLYERPFLDNYNSTNVLFGHAPLYYILSAGFAADPLKMASLYWLSVPLHEDLGLARIESVTFADDDIHRLTVKYTAGMRVWVNRSDKPWSVQGVVLPRYGYLVKGKQLDQQLSIEAGAPLEVMRAGDLLYVDFRGLRRDYTGVQADGAVLVRHGPAGLEVIPLAGNSQPVRVDLEKLGAASGANTIRAELVWADQSRSPLAVHGMTIDVPPQPPVNIGKLADVCKRPLHKAVVRVTN